MTINLFKKIIECYFTKNGANLLFTKIFLPAISIWEKTALCLGKLIKYLKDLT